MKLRYLPLVFSLLLFSVSATAQPGDKTKSADKNSTATAPTAKDAEAERILKERRDNAQSLLISLAADAAQFTDQTLRARTQARIADVLWAADPERARALFRKAWDSAEVVYQEGQRKLQEDVRQQQAKGGSVAVTSPPNIRGEVLRLAARRDRTLGEELLAKLRDQKQQEADAAAGYAKADPFASTPEAIRQRLSLARQLLDTDVERALQFADPALGNLTRDAVDFLSYLREKDALAADQRYSVLLARAAGDLQSDANTVSLLSSYLFTPHIYVTFTNSGASTTQSGRNNAPPEVAAELRRAFFQAAGEILLRPLAPPGQDQTTAGVQGKYLMLRRLSPLFDRYAPKELADAVRAQTEALAQGVPEDARNRDDDTMREGIREPQSSADREKSLRDRLDRAKTPEERDALNFQLAWLYAESGDLRARDYVDKIDDSDLRKQARSYIDANLIIRALEKKDADLVVQLVKTAEITHLQKSWTLTQAAKLLAKSDREKALQTVEEAALEARRIEDSDPDRARALMAVANALLSLDRTRAWDAVYDAIKAANGVEGFSGEDGVVRTSIRTREMSSIRSSGAPDFDVAGIFTELARDDYSRAVELVRGFQKEAPRAIATIAIAKAVLEEKKK